MSPEIESEQIYLETTISMTKREANARKFVSEEVDGVEFEHFSEFVSPNGDSHTPPENRVFGRTTARTEEALDEFNLVLKEFLHPNPS